MSAEDRIRAEIRALASYPVQPAEGMVKLDAMENPFAFPEGLRAGLAEALAATTLNRYPAASATELKQSIRDAMRIPAELDILLGNGSDEIIQLIAMAVAKPGAALLSVEPAFVMFKMIATFCGLRYVGVPLREDFSLDLTAVLSAIERERPAVAFIAYPNNPTGNRFDRAAIRTIIAALAQHDGLAVIDEAYFAFSPDTFLDEISQYDNAMLLRTVSKLGLAGIRLGMLIGRPQWLAEFDKLRLPYNINVLTQAAAKFALAHYDQLLLQTKIIATERERVAAALDRIAGLTRYPSDANFILIRVADAGKTYAALLSRRILVKNTSASHPLMQNTLRLSIGTPAENDALLAALVAALTPIVQP
ncbi:MAG: histidinol-phosphate transaminase [Betaproteobacteria bacterium]|nr:histidinol-phosphate transaminase [Betaproteobacteria bacterium]